MKEIRLTKGYVALVDDDDFEWLNQYKWCAHFTTGSKQPYAVRSEYVGDGKQKTVSMHRLIMGVCNKPDWIDHKDRNKLNNQRGNLRIATSSQNAANRCKKGVFIGIMYEKNTRCIGKWRAQIKKNGKTYNLGNYKTKEEAAYAYNKAAVLHHGEFATLNNIIETA